MDPGSDRELFQGTDDSNDLYLVICRRAIAVP